MGTLILFAAIVVASLCGFLSRTLLAHLVLRPHDVVYRRRYWQLLSSGFVHADLAHLVLNLITFYSFGFALERAIGTRHLVALFFIGLLVSGLGTTLKHRAEPAYASLGASGAILAVLFASVLHFPHSRLYVMPLPLPIPAPLFAAIYLAFTVYSSRQRRDRINHDAHLWGALAGVAFVAVTDPATLNAFLQTTADATRSLWQH